MSSGNDDRILERIDKLDSDMDTRFEKVHEKMDGLSNRATVTERLVDRHEERLVTLFGWRKVVNGAAGTIIVALFLGAIGWVASKLVGG
ncbi:MAG TPA: hypothetical protein VJB38_12385 [Bacteroidota bacterium]|nr:hypothetical protein [Bacteroidota bacterium]